MNGDSHSKGRLSPSPKSSDNKVISVSEQDVSVSSHRQVKSNETLESQSIIISDINASKKSSFQITGFVDNSSSESELQPSSIKQQSLDTVRKKNPAALSKNLESELQTTKSFSPIVTPISTNPLDLNDIQTSRFKVVRIASTKKPIVRGRWMCQDFNFERPVQYLVGKPINEEDVYYIEQNDDPMYKHFGMVYTDGHLTLDDNFIDKNTRQAPPDSSFDFCTGVCILPSPSSSEPPIQHRSSLIVTEPQEFTDPEVCTSASMCAIDNKIEQAMDLVKSHLMFAVHEEVEQLKEQIKDLLIAKNLLVKENNLLREHALPETLAKLKLLHLSGDEEEEEEEPQETVGANNESVIDEDNNQYFSNDSGIMKNSNAEMAGNDNGDDENALYEDAADGYKSDKVAKVEDNNNNNIRADDDDDDDSSDEEDIKEEKDANHNQNNINDGDEEDGRIQKKTEDSNSSEEDKDHNHHHQTVNNENPLNNSDSNFYDNNNSHNKDNVSITATTSLQNSNNNENVHNNNSTNPSS